MYKTYNLRMHVRACVLVCVYRVDKNVGTPHYFEKYFKKYFQKIYFHIKVIRFLVTLYSNINMTLNEICQSYVKITKKDHKEIF